MHNYIVNHYVEKRKQQTQMEIGSMYVTPRTLLGVIRTAQAIAKLRFADLVDQDDIDEAMRLIDACRNSVENVGKESSSFDSFRNSSTGEIFITTARSATDTGRSSRL